MVDTVDIVARTAWGEARGCGIWGMQRVINVMVNRSRHPSWWGRDLASVCLAPKQFSCWNHDDPNYEKLTTVTIDDPQFKQALGLAKTAVSGALVDASGGADSYYAASMAEPPYWAKDAAVTTEDGWHVFLKTAASEGAPGPVSTHATEHSTEEQAT